MSLVSPAVTLALDTATPYLTLALQWEDGALERSLHIGRAHAERLPQEAQALFDEAGLPFVAQCVVIGLGPGSYTGVRVGASYALGLAAVWGVSVLGVPTLEALIDPQQDGLQAVGLDARKEQVYGAVYVVEQGMAKQVKQPPGKCSAAEFVQYQPRLDPVPSGLALLRAGQHHGSSTWELLYL